MGAFVKGDVVVVPFPFSDLSAAKRRPALVVAEAGGRDLILCQITSRPVSGPYAFPISDADFADGGLRQPSNVRPNRLFTAESSIILSRAGTLRPEAMRRVTESLVALLTA